MKQSVPCADSVRSAHVQCVDTASRLSPSFTLLQATPDALGWHSQQECLPCCSQPAVGTGECNIAPILLRLSWLQNRMCMHSCPPWSADLHLARPGVPGLCRASCPRQAVTAIVPAMQVYKWLTLIPVLICLMCGQPWNWHSDKVVIGRLRSSHHAATKATLQAVVAQLSSHHAATEATLQAVRAQLTSQQAACKATLQAVQVQARLLAAHVGGPVPAEQLAAWRFITNDPPHSEAPAVSIDC